jgi:predicted short-subunit dehydrogenase-like oxidoreductase (DUF2520 family)
MSEPKEKSEKRPDYHQPRRTSPTRRAYPAVAIIGPGRLGGALGRALGSIGYRIEVVVARSATGGRKAKRLLPADALYLASAQPTRLSAAQFNRLRGCNLVLITTPDDVIGAVATGLSDLFADEPLEAGRTVPRRIALHTSGALGSEVLGPLRTNGFGIGSLHPLVSISDAAAGAKLFRRAFFCIEGDRSAVTLSRAIVRDLGGESFSIAPNSKPLYHAAAVTSSGHLVALFDIAVEMMTRCGLSKSRAREVLLPLVRSTLASLEEKEPERALTGTFSRADSATVRHHLAAIKSANLSDALAAYSLLGKRAIQLARRTKTSQEELDRIEKLIDGATSEI